MTFVLEGKEVVQVYYKDKTIWVTQKAMSILFDVDVPAISNHLKNILREESCAKIQLFPFWKQLGWQKQYEQMTTNNILIDLIKQSMQDSTVQIRRSLGRRPHVTTRSKAMQQVQILEQVRQNIQVGK